MAACTPSLQHALFVCGRTWNRIRSVELRYGTDCVLALSAGIVLLCCEPGSSNNDDDGSLPTIGFSRDAASPILSFACDGASGGDETALLDGPPVGGCAVENPNVGFRADVLPVFQGCSGELCHNAWSYETTVNITSTECCDKRKIVDPGNPSGSYLIQKVRGMDLCGNSSKMGDLTPAQARNLADWICLGAPDN